MTAKRLQGIGTYYFSDKLREIAMLEQKGIPVINLGIGSPDLPPHPEVIRILQEEAAKPGAHTYQGYKGIAALRGACAEWYRRVYGVNLNPDREILPLMGSKEGIMHICMTYLDPGDKVLVPDPGYPAYSSAVQLAGGEVLYYNISEYSGATIDISMLEQEDLTSVKLMFLNYPHMPTGRIADMDLFQQLVAFARKHNILLVHDNPYSFILNNQPLSILQVEGAMEVAIELNSLSKSHNMAGWRVGFMAGTPERMEQVLRFKSNMDSGMFLPLQLAAVKALELCGDWYDYLNKVYAERKAKAAILMELLDCTYSDQQAGMFLWGHVPESFENGYELSDMLLKNCQVFVTPGGIFGNGGLRYIRISLCSPICVYDEAIERIQHAGINNRPLSLIPTVSG